jgi:hypothetical protein
MGSLSPAHFVGMFLGIDFILFFSLCLLVEIGADNVLEVVLSIGFDRK